MRLTTEISPDDHRLFYQSVTGEGVEEAKAQKEAKDLSRSGHDLYLSLAVLLAVVFVLVLWAVYRFGFDGVLSQPLPSIAIFIGVLCVLVTTLWFICSRQVFKALKDAANGNYIDQRIFRNGLNIGDTRFNVEQTGITYSSEHVQSSYSWPAFHGLKETATAFHLMITDGSGLIVPKRAFGTELQSQEFQAFVAERIGAGK